MFLKMNVDVRSNIRGSYIVLLKEKHSLLVVHYHVYNAPVYPVALYTESAYILWGSESVLPIGPTYTVTRDGFLRSQLPGNY